MPRALKNGWVVYDHYTQQGQNFLYFYYYRRRVNAEKAARRTNKLPGHRAEVRRAQNVSPSVSWTEDHARAVRSD